MNTAVFQTKVAHLFLGFILIQPVLDLLTTYMELRWHPALTIGMVVRMLALLCGLAVLLFFYRGSLKKKMLMLLLLLGTSLLIGMIQHAMVKNLFNPFLEIKFIAKSVYFPIMLFTYICIFQSLSKKRDWPKKTIQAIYGAVCMIGIVMLLSALTHTAIPSYTYQKEGWQGWFYAANELGPIMAGTSFIAVSYAFRQKRWFYWVPIAMIIASMLIIGTKVGYLSAFILLIVSLCIAFYNMWKQKQWHPVIICLVLFAAFVAATPYSPVIHNSERLMQWIGDRRITTHHMPETKSDQHFQTVVLSHRDLFLSHHQQQYGDADGIQKLFGMGYAGDYKKAPKIIEMDFYDLFFSYGIVGTFFYLLPLFAIALTWLFAFFKKSKTHSPETVFFVCGIGIMSGISFLAGHVWFAPAVSVYLAVMIAYLFVRWEVWE